MIFSDVYFSVSSLPTHFTTREFFQIAKEKLHADGLFIANIHGKLSEESSFILSEIKTFQSVFPNSYFFATQSIHSTLLQNIIFVGFKSDRKVDFNSSEIKTHPDYFIRGLPDKLVDISRFDLSPYPILTDNFAPVEYMLGQMLRHLDR